MDNINSEILNSIVSRYEDEDILKADGFDKAVIGMDEYSMRLIYSYTKIIQILMEDMTREEAEEYFGYNIQSAWFGEKTPIYCMDDYDGIY